MRKLVSTNVIVTLLLVLVVGAAPDDPSVPEGPYLGQKPPGKRPELFAPGVISVEANFEHSAAVFSPDGREVFWCTNVGFVTDKSKAGNLRLYFMNMVDGRWTPPRPAPFVKDIRVERPVFSPDGNRLYIEYGSNPHQESDTDIYVVERTGGGWSAPRPVSPLINTPAMERLHCVTADGSLYFSRDPFTRREEILVARWVKGAFTEPEKLDESYNSPAQEIALLVAPDESYMLVATINARHSDDLCICYKKADGSWTDRIPTPYECGGFLALSPDGKYLFFLMEGIAWISTSFVDDLKPQDMK
jgi:hypothetical protein